MKTTKQITMSEDLFNEIMKEVDHSITLHFEEGNPLLVDRALEVLDGLELAYEDGHYTDVVEAYRRLSEGEAPNWSTGLCERPTVGYGELDSSGYFEFPLIIDEETKGIMSWEDYIK